MAGETELGVRSVDFRRNRRLVRFGIQRGAVVVVGDGDRIGAGAVPQRGVGLIDRLVRGVTEDTDLVIVVRIDRGGRSRRQVVLGVLDRRHRQGLSGDQRQRRRQQH